MKPCRHALPTTSLEHLMKREHCRLLEESPVNRFSTESTFNRGINMSGDALRHKNKTQNGRICALRCLTAVSGIQPSVWARHADLRWTFAHLKSKEANPSLSVLVSERTLQRPAAIAELRPAARQSKTQDWHESPARGCAHCVHSPHHTICVRSHRRDSNKFPQTSQWNCEILTLFSQEQDALFAQVSTFKRTVFQTN